MNRKLLLLFTPALIGAGLFNKSDSTRAIDGMPHPYKPSMLAVGPQKDIDNRMVVQDIARIDELDVYLNTKLLMIKKMAGMDSVPGRVVVTASPLLNATTSPDGNIFIGIGFIRNLSTEDEVMALLSHEFAHAVFNHNNSDLIAKMQQNVINAADQFSSLRKKFGGIFPTQNSKANDIQNNLKNSDLALQLTKTLVLPAWQREQEIQADFLAIDITQKMGYSYSRGMKSFLELLQNEDIQDRALQKSKKKEFEENFSSSLVKVDSKSEAMDAVKNFGVSMQGILESMMAKTHYPAEKRLEKCNDYYEKFYGEDGAFQLKTTVHEKEWASIRNRPAIKASLSAYKSAFEAENRLDVLDSKNGLSIIESTVKTPISRHPYRTYILARAYRVNGDYPRFEQTVAQSEKSGQISWRLVQLKADYELTKGNNGAAIQIYESEFNRRGKPPNAMPDMHELYVRTGNTTKADSMQLSCQFGQGKNSKECNKAKSKK